MRVAIGQLRVLLAAGALLLSGCGSNPANGDDGGPGGDSGNHVVDDGTPTRVACTSGFGSALSSTHGRLDGFLVSIVAPGHNGCNGDSDHLHLQVKMKGALYDVAVTVVSTTAGSPDVSYTEWDGALPTHPWKEGWDASAALNYTSLGVHSPRFTATAKADLVATLNTALADVNHISVYGTGYGSDGMHLVHWNSGYDGAIVIEPLSTPAHWLMFRFPEDNF